MLKITKNTNAGKQYARRIVRKLIFNAETVQKTGYQTAKLCWICVVMLYSGWWVYALIRYHPVTSSFTTRAESIKTTTVLRCVR